jgi:broad specificity phosphatase PhoE
MIQPKDFYYIRHGETDWNLAHRGMGQKNIPLNARGIGQAYEAAKILKNELIETICYSPLDRAKDTANIIGANRNCHLVEVPELTECCWGDREGDFKEKWIDDWVAGVKINGAECYSEFIQRALIGINKSLEHKGPVLVVSHGGVFWAVQQFAQLGNRFDLRNGVPIFLRAPFIATAPWSTLELE